MPESQHIEWKETWRDEWLKWICGFANAEGGVLHIGRNDHGNVVGLTDAVRLLEELPNKVRDLLGILVEVNLRQEAGADYLEIVTTAYPSPISYRGHYFQRVGSTLQELKGASLDRFLLRRFGRTWDGTPLPGVAASDLSADALARFRALAARSGRLETTALEESDASLLEKLKLTSDRHLKRAAVLLFHGDPLKFVSGAFVKIGFFRSATELVYHDEITGDLLHQGRQTIDLLFTKYLKAAVAYDDIVRVERFPVARTALREAVLNALVHRDYAVAAPVQIRVYDDRLTIWNPAVLPEGWTQQTLLGPHASHPYNPDLANTFFRAGEIEAWGHGIERMFAAAREDGAPEPQLRFDAGGLWTEFPFSHAYLAAMAGTGDHSSSASTDPVADPVADPVDQVLLALARGAQAPSAIQKRVGLKHRPTFRTNYLRPALSLGLIEMTLPEKPGSRLQKYRLTAAGEIRLKALPPRNSP